MATVPSLNNFVAGTAIISDDVDENFSTLKSFVETALVQTDGTVQAGTAAIADSSVTGSKIAAGAVGSTKIDDAAVVEAKIGTSAVTTAKIADGAVTMPKLGAPTNTTAKTTSTITLALSDANTTILADSGSAQAVTVPLNTSVAFPVGTQLSFIQIGAGQLSFSPESAGVTLNSDTSKRKILVRYGAATLIKVATDSWILIGNLVA